MSYGRLNIWLRELDCTPKNVWKMELVVKTCGGEYLVDFNPNVIDKLKEALPDFTVQRGTRNHETTINIVAPRTQIKHVEVDVPPGCYIVRAWVCWGNLWTDRAMAIVGCGQEACVNLFVPEKRYCIRGVLEPVAIAWHNLKLNPEELRVGLDFLMKAGQIEKEPLLRDLADLRRELAEVDVKEAGRYVEAFDLMAKALKDTSGQREKKK